MTDLADKKRMLMPEDEFNARMSRSWLFRAAMTSFVVVGGGAIGGWLLPGLIVALVRWVRT